MKGINPTFLIALPALILGIVITPLFNITLSESGYVFCALFLFVAAVHFALKLKQMQSIISTLAVFFLFVSLGNLLFSLSDPKNQKSHYTYWIQHQKPENNFYLRIEEKLRPAFYSARFVVTVTQIGTKTTSGKLILNIEKDSASPLLSLHVDDQILVKTALAEITPPRNPYQFDYQEYLRKAGIYHQITASTPEVYLIKRGPNSLSGYADALRTKLNTDLNKFAFSKDAKAVLNALLLGQRQELSTTLRDDYANAGVMHILAVSGLHVGILMLVLQFLLKPIGNYRYARLLRTLLIIAVIWIFAFITGLSPSVLRAATMFTFIQLGTLLHQRQAGFNALLTSAVILLVFNPSLIYEVGFQLSYAAVFAIMWLYPKLEPLWNPKNKILKYYWQLIAVSISAQLGVLPLSLYYFHQFPGLFLIANIVVLPALGFLLIYGLILLLLAATGILPQFIASFYNTLLNTLNQFVSTLAQFDVLLFKNVYFSIPLVILSYLLLFFMVQLAQKKNFINLVGSLTVLIAFPLSLALIEYNQATPALYIHHLYKTSLFTYRSADLDYIFYTEKNQQVPENLLANFKSEQRIAEIYHEELKPIFKVNESYILRIDSLGVYDLKAFKPDYIVLSQSPKINLERVLKRFPNTRIIADGSNYKSYVDRWESTCLKKKIPFHNTYEKGFYKIE